MEKIKQVVKKYWENITLLEVFLILAAAGIMMFGLLYKLGTLSSGFHFLDDHELIRMECSFQEQQSLGSVMKGWLDNDLKWRFRPLYWVERTTLAFFFGTNMLYWNIYTAIKGLLTFALLYFTARYLKCNPIVSGLFTCVILYGAQFTPWYRSANQENTGLLLCALSMCLIAAQADCKKFKSVILNVLIVLSAILCGLMKESFTLLLPAFAAVRYWLEYKTVGDGRLWECFKRHWLMYGMLMATFVVNICVLLFWVGVDQVSYAGFHQGSGLAEYWQGMVRSYQLYLRQYVNMAIVLLALLVLRAGKKNWKKYGSYCLIGAYVIGVQLVAHAKSGMWERYIIPGIVGYAAVFVILGYKMLQHRKISSILYAVLVCALVATQVPTVLAKGRDYAYDGRMISLYFQAILDNTDENSHVISMFFDEELNLATECWLETHGRTQVYSGKTDTGELRNQVQLMGTAPENLNLQNASVVTCYDNQVQNVLDICGLTDTSKYTVNINGHYAVICRTSE